MIDCLSSPLQRTMSTKKYIHVNQHKIKANRKNGTEDPVLTVKDYKSNTYCNELEILDDAGHIVAKVIYRPEKPLSCGAEVWIETHREVRYASKSRR